MERPPIERAPTAAEQDTQWRSKMKPDPVPNPPTPTVSAGRSPALSNRELSAPPSPAPAPPPPAARPKLNLAKRTVSESPAEAQASAPSTESKASPFGAARPIDTATKEKEIEEKRQIALREKKEAEEKAREEKRISEEKAKEERKAAKDAELAARPAAKSEPSPKSPNQLNGDKRQFPRREKPEIKPKVEKENGAAGPPSGKQYEILRRHTEEGTSAADEEAEENEAAAKENGLIAGDKQIKPQEIIRDPKAEGYTNGAGLDASPNPTAEALEEEGWSTVSKPERKGRKSNQAARAVAS